MLLREIGNLFQAAGCGTVGVDLFLGSSPDSPDAVLALIPYAGLAPQVERGRPPGVTFERPRVQIIARDRHPEAAYARAEAAYRALIPVANEHLGETWYLDLAPLQSPFSLGPDDAGRHRYGFNVEAMRGRERTNHA